jgi:hypothetical protein
MLKNHGESLAALSLPKGYPSARAGRGLGRFLPFAIYLEMDSPQECQSNINFILSRRWKM